MKTEKNILLAFLLNLSFSIFEFIGGLFTGSVAILSDSLHDLGDAASIGISFFLEKKSKRGADEKYTYGYAGFSTIGSVITTLILLLGSLIVFYSSVKRIFYPVSIDYSGMIVFAILGVCINLAAALFTRGGGSLNQRAVNLHMLEDSLGWIAVFIGAIVMKFTDISLIDPLISICISVFIAANAIKNLGAVTNILLFKTPREITVPEIKDHILEIDGVIDVHHVHIWSIDSQTNYATMHIVTSSNNQDIKKLIRKELQEHGISHVTIEFETKDEECYEPKCRVNMPDTHAHHHHAHHHHH